MIVGIGIDSVDIGRMTSWIQYPMARLYRLFTPHELAYAFSIPEKQTERLAARFAVKEAFFKAYSSWHPDHGTPFLTICRLLELQAREGTAPQLKVAWHSLLGQTFDVCEQKPLCHVSITHTKSIATAFVILETPPTPLSTP